MSIINQSKEIFEGFVNFIFKDEQIELKAKERLSKCFICPLRDNDVCSKRKEFKGTKGCGCNLKLKSRSGSPCPLSNW